MLIQKCGYIKPKGAARYLRYIATREGVELRPRAGPATEKQEKLIGQVLKDYQDSVDLFEYADYLAAPSAATAAAFLTMALDVHATPDTGAFSLDAAYHDADTQGLYTMPLTRSWSAKRKRPGSLGSVNGKKTVPYTGTVLCGHTIYFTFGRGNLITFPHSSAHSKRLFTPVRVISADSFISSMSLCMVSSLPSIKSRRLLMGSNKFAIACRSFSSNILITSCRHYTGTGPDCQAEVSIW